MFYRIVPPPLRESPPPPFIDTRRDGVHAQGVMKVVIFSPNRGGAVVVHCGKYTMGYGAGRGCHPGHRPWSCGDHPGVLAAPAGGVAAFRGSRPCRSRAPRKGKYEGCMGSWQYRSWSSVEHVLHCIAGSHNAATAPGSSDRSWRTGLRSLDRKSVV